MTRLTTREAADYVRLSKGTLDQMRTDGTGPRFIKLGRKRRGRIFYDTVDLDAWINSRKQTSTTDQPQLRRRRRRLNNPLDLGR
jgi:excisionase family DNA binding protein